MRHKGVGREAQPPVHARPGRLATIWQQHWGGSRVAQRPLCGSATAHTAVMLQHHRKQRVVKLRMVSEGGAETNAGLVNSPLMRLEQGLIQLPLEMEVAQG